MLYMTIGSVTIVTDMLGILLINPHSPLAPSSHAYISPNPLLPCYKLYQCTTLREQTEEINTDTSQMYKGYNQLYPGKVYL